MTKGYYDARELANVILNKHPGIRFSPDYEGMKDYIIEITMSCNRDEQRGWMRHYMSQAIRMDREAVSRKGIPASARAGMRYEAAVQFMVAYDLIG